MPKKQKQSDRFADLTWDDLEDWAGSSIVARGERYQRQGRVSGLAMTDSGSLVAWVDGSKRYATKVDIFENGMLVSDCNCPYEFDCKHSVAVVLEYLARLEDEKSVPKTGNSDERLEILESVQEDGDSAHLSENVKKEIDTYLKGKNKSQLMEIIIEYANRYPAIGRELSDRNQLAAGNTKALVTRLRREIRDLGEEPDWGDYWNGEGDAPNFSVIRNKLEALLAAGCADDVLSLGEELLDAGVSLVEMIHDEGETGMEISACMPVIVKALERSSLKPVDKLVWAVDTILKDEYDLCEDLGEYLDQQHKSSDWSLMADVLLERMKVTKLPRELDGFGLKCARDRLSNLAIHALDQAGRKKEIIPLCEAEAKITGSYDRLVDLLIEQRCFEDAEHWIREGIAAVEQNWPGMANGLRNRLREIRSRQKNWPVVAAMNVDEFIRSPSQRTYTDCKKSASKVNIWPQVREYLLAYLESGKLPWKQPDWPLPASGLALPEEEKPGSFPMVNELIDIAIMEKKPDQILRWYDQRPRKGFGWAYAYENEIATAVQAHAPDRAVSIWKQLAEGQIAQVKPRAYQEAARYLRKAARLMSAQNKQAEWDQYIKSLKEQHARKRRLMEILDTLDGKPIMKKKQ